MKDSSGYLLALAIIAIKLLLDVELATLHSGWVIDLAGLILTGLGVYLLVGFFVEWRRSGSVPEARSNRS